MWDKLAVVRSLDLGGRALRLAGQHGYSEQVNRVAAHPCFGSVVSKLRGDGAGDVPPFVSLRGGGSVGTEPGYLGVGHRPFTPSGAGVENLRLADGVSAERIGARKDLLATFDTAAARSTRAAR
jgi:hypothetical protein